MVNTAPVKWAQRDENIFLTIDLPDVEKDSAKIDLSDDKLVFSGKSNGKDYVLDIEFVKEGGGIDSSSEESKYAIKPRNISFFLVKKKEGFWPRLLEDRQLQKTNVKVDFDKWVDSDDEDEPQDFNTSGMEGMGGMMGGGGGMGGGMGGMPGMDGGMGGMDMAKLMQQMQGMGGMPGMEGMGGMPGMGEMPPAGNDEDGDSDDDLPDLE